MSTSRERLARLAEQDAQLAKRGTARTVMKTVTIKAPADAAVKKSLAGKAKLHEDLRARLKSMTTKEPAAKAAARKGGLADRLQGFEKSSSKNPAPAKTDALADRLARKADQAKAVAGPAGRAEKAASTKFKAPKTLALCADELYATRNERLAKEKEAAALQEKETFLKEHLIANLPKSDASGVAGKVARVTITTKKTPRVNDWSKFYAHIVGDYNKHAKKKDGQQDGAFSLLNKAVGKAAVQERWDSGVTVPGVEAFNAPDVSINKV